MATEKQIKEKISKLQDEISDLEEQLPTSVSTRGDPVVRFNS